MRYGAEDMRAVQRQRDNARRERDETERNNQALRHALIRVLDAHAAQHPDAEDKPGPFLDARTLLKTT